MIPRYSRKAMSDIWTDNRRYQAWFEIEVLAAEALSRTGKVPKKAIANIRRKVFIDVPRILDAIWRTVSVTRVSVRWRGRARASMRPAASREFQSKRFINGLMHIARNLKPLNLSYDVSDTEEKIFVENHAALETLIDAWNNFFEPTKFAALT